MINMAAFDAPGEEKPEAVVVLIRRDHAYKKKSQRTVAVIDPRTKEPVLDGAGKPKKKIVKPKGCAVCSGAKEAEAHQGHLTSMNDHSIAFDEHAFRRHKAVLQHIIARGLDESGLKRCNSSVYVEALVGFPEYRGVDEDNIKWLLSKATGDALVYGFHDEEKRINIEGGWLEDDTFWPVGRYRMGPLEGEHTAGESWIQMTFYASREEPIPAPRMTKSSIPTTP